MNTVTAMQFLLYIIWLGMEVAAVFDSYRAVMLYYKVNRWVLAWFDGCMAGILGIFVFQKLYAWNGGELRLVYLILFVMGILFYTRMMSNYFRIPLNWSIKIIDRILRLCNRLLTLLFWIPLKKAILMSWSVCTRIFLFICRKIKIKRLTKGLKSS